MHKSDEKSKETKGERSNTCLRIQDLIDKSTPQKARTWEMSTRIKKRKGTCGRACAGLRGGGRGHAAAARVPCAAAPRVPRDAAARGEQGFATTLEVSHVPRPRGGMGGHGGKCWSCNPIFPRARARRPAQLPQRLRDPIRL